VTGIRPTQIDGIVTSAHPRQDGSTREQTALDRMR